MDDRGAPDQDNDDNKSILNNASFGSSFTVVSVNGRVARFGGDKGRIQLTKKQGNAIITRWEFAGALFTQEVTLYKGHYSARDNLARVKHWVENKSGKTLQVGIRVVLDPMLGPEDDRPFLVPGRGAVTHGTLLKTRDDIPSFIYGCHKPVKGQGDFVLNLYGPDLVMPDRVYFARDSYLSDDSALEPGENPSLGSALAGKSSLALVWSPRDLQAGKADGIAFAVGAACHVRREGQPLNLMLSVPYRAVGEEYWVGVVVENEDTYWDVSDLSISLRHEASSVRLVRGNPVYRFQRLPRSGMVFAYWKLTALAGGRTTVTIDIGGTYRSQSLSARIQGTTELTK